MAWNLQQTIKFSQRTFSSAQSTSMLKQISSMPGNCGGCVIPGRFDSPEWCTIPQTFAHLKARHKTLH